MGSMKGVPTGRCGGGRAGSTIVLTVPARRDG